VSVSLTSEDKNQGIKQIINLKGYRYEITLEYRKRKILFENLT